MVEELEEVVMEEEVMEEEAMEEVDQEDPMVDQEEVNKSCTNICID